MIGIEGNTELAVERYRTGDVSLNRAAEIADYSPGEFKTVLRDRSIGRDVGFLDDGEHDERLQGL